MKIEDVVVHIDELLQAAKNIRTDDHAKFRGLHARISDFFMNFAGKNSPFLSQLDMKIMPGDRAYEKVW